MRTPNYWEAKLIELDDYIYNPEVFQGIPVITSSIIWAVQIALEASQQFEGEIGGTINDRRN